MMTSAAPERIYFDNAATSWPKPDCVYQAMDRYLREVGAPAGRSGYAEALAANRLVEQARSAVARILGAESPDRVAFTLNCTDALNAAIHGVVRDGDHVVTSQAEHNSILRPLSTLAAQGEITVTHVNCDHFGRIDPADVRRGLEARKTRLVALAHASNVTGAVQPLEEIGRMARERGALFLVDAAQSLGHVPLSVQSLGCDLLAAPGHKGLLGPLGTGVLYVRPGVDSEVSSFRQGGTGTQSEQDVHPSTMPEKLEAGNLNLPGIVGLGAACAYLLERTVKSVSEHEQNLLIRLFDVLADLDGLEIYASRDRSPRCAVLSFNVHGADCHEVAGMLDSAFRIQVRAGLHCAARIHDALGTRMRGGTVRVSPGPFNNVEQIERFGEAIAEVVSGASQAA
jgi:cysteine desulfurase family protein